jgi:hypothetical protein
MLRQARQDNSASFKIEKMISKKIVLLSLLPIVTVGAYIYFFGINIPFWDQWENVSLLMKQQQSALTMADLFKQHNEHRPFFPRLIWIGLAKLTHYNVKAEQWTNLIIAGTVFVFFIHRSIRTWREYNVTVPPSLIPLLSLLVFNLGHRESWLQGFQTIMFLGMACIVIGFFLIVENNPIFYVIAMVLGVMATYSMVNGLFYWPIGLVILFFTAPPKTKAIRIIAWLVCGGLCVGLFLENWMSTANINPAYLFANMSEWLIWLLNFLGAPLLAFWYVAWIFGVLSIGLYILVLVKAIKVNLWKPMIPYLAITAFILITALLISVGRIEFGLRQSTVSRYITMSVWYWASLLVLLPFSNLKPLHLRFLYLMVTASLVFLTIAGGWVGYVRIYQRILPAYEAVTSGQTLGEDILSNIYPRPNEIQPQIDFLRENKLSAWSEIR